MRTPIYEQFRKLSLSRDRSIESSTSHSQASNPLLTACLALVEHHIWTPERIAPPGAGLWHTSEPPWTP
jgi:hypothetical protein